MQVGPQLPGPPHVDEPDEEPKNSSKNQKPDAEGWGSTLFKMFESAVTTFASVAILGFVAIP